MTALGSEDIAGVRVSIEQCCWEDAVFIHVNFELNLAFVLCPFLMVGSWHACVWAF